MKIEITRSGMIKSLDYNKTEKELIVEFNSGSYKYFDVPEEVFNECLAAESAGKYFLSNIKNKFEFEKC